MAQGEIERANEFLGHPYTLSDRVSHGKKLGSTLGFPTVNLRLKENVLSPAKGVYATKVILENGETHPAVTNVGTRPTVDDGNQLTIEGFILDFQGDLYGQKIQMEFYKYLAEERKFPSFAALTAEVMHNASRPGNILPPIPETQHAPSRAHVPCWGHAVFLPGSDQRLMSRMPTTQAPMPRIWWPVSTSLYQSTPTRTRIHARARLATREATLTFHPAR